jgi:transcriptional regulator with XRE-family HTH domain
MSHTREGDRGASLLAFFGAELRRRRVAAGLSLEELGSKISFSGSLIGKVETGERLPKPDLALACDEAFGSDGLFTRLCQAIKDEARAYPSGFPEYLDTEREAVSISKFDVLYVPGLLQIGDYARALFRAGRPRDTDDEIERLVAARLERQEILERRKPPMLWFVIDEAALRRPVGGSAVMVAQLGQISGLAERPGVVVQVVPFAAGAHAGLLGTFTLLSLGDGTDLAYTESVTASQLIERPEDVAEFTLAYDMLRIEALSREASLDFIRTVQGEYERESQSLRMAEEQLQRGKRW